MTPEEKLNRKIETAKKECARSIAWAKAQFYFETKAPEIVAKKIDAMIKENKNKEASKLFYIALDKAKRLKVAKILVGKAHSIKAYVHAVSFVSMNNLVVSEPHYSIEFCIRPLISIRHEKYYKTKPEAAEIIEVAKTYFPSIKMII